ncbi:hypothetical protein Dip518_000299 [Parelusimicrobium proximum]|uniref:hypothetical protein n=1 Tax=Parelusimicrobium proximum TaxID=3228953 RepID=UPI003D16641E
MAEKDNLTCEENAAAAGHLATFFKTRKWKIISFLKENDEEEKTKKLKTIKKSGPLRSSRSVKESKPAGKIKKRSKK